MKSNPGIILGRQKENNNNYLFNGIGPLTTFLSSAKNVKAEMLCKNILKHEGSKIIIDAFDGQIYKKTANLLKDEGYEIITIDPFGIINGQSDTYNPFDFLHFNKSLFSDNVRLFTSELFNIHKKSPLASKYTIDGYAMKSLAIDLASAVILYINAVPEKTLNMRELATVFTSDDVVYNLAVVLDTLKTKIPFESRQNIASFLQRSDAERSQITTNILLYITPYLSETLLSSLDKTSFDLGIITSGKPFMLYFMIPPSKMLSHSFLLQMWVSSIIQMIADTKKTKNDSKILFLLDCASGTGNIPFYYNILQRVENPYFQIWTFWESISEFQTNYPLEWKTILGNSSIIQIFDIQKPIHVQDLATIAGISEEQLLNVPMDEHLVILENGETVFIRNIA